MRADGGEFSPQDFLYRKVLPVIAAGGLVLGGCRESPRIPTVAQVEATTTTTEPDGPAQLDLEAMICPPVHNEAEANAVLHDELISTLFGRVQLGKNIDWAANPFEHPSWLPELNSLTWLQPSIDRQTPADVAKVRAILQDWLADNPLSGPENVAWGSRTTGRRALVLQCAQPLFGKEAWWQKAVTLHGNVLADPRYYAGSWNHGFVQDVALMQLGCLDKRSDWIKTAQDRAVKGIQAAVDPQGADHEQAPAYARYVWRLFGRFVQTQAACGEPLPLQFKRLSLLRNFLVEATRPDGTFEQIGDSFQETGLPPQETLPKNVIYDAGYIFSRTDWTPRAGFLTLRFGPPRAIHGHADHTALTYMAHGQEWLIDAGTPGYETSPYRDWVLSADAHNVVTVDGAGKPKNGPTTLVSQEITDRWQRYELRDMPYEDINRSRQVVHVTGPQEMLLVADQLTDHQHRRLSMNQRWHLADNVQVDATDAAHIKVQSKDGKRTLHILQMYPTAQSRILTGSQMPIEGWRSRSFQERQPAPTLMASQHGDHASFLTVMLDAPSNETISATWVDLQGKQLLRVQSGQIKQDFIQVKNGFQPVP